jgi:hypothetical protein
VWQVAADLIFGATFSDFLSSNHVADITQPADRENCTANWTGTKAKPCRGTYYVPGGIEGSIPAILNSSDFAESDVFLFKDQQGYVLEFQDGNMQRQYNASSECSAYGSDQMAFAICLQNGTNNEIHAREQMALL